MSTNVHSLGTSAAPPAPMVSQAGSASMRRWLLRRVWVVVLYLLLAGIAVLMAAPFVAMISVSLQTGGGAARFPIDWIPPEPTLENYESIVRRTAIGRWFLNSLIVAATGTVLALMTASTAGYAFARMDFPGRTVWFWSFLAMLMVPSQVTLIPEYLLLAKLNWVNTFVALILPGITSAFGVFLIRQYLESIPRDFEDAARLDGASEWQVFCHVVLPMLLPALATLGTLQFLNYWNEFLYPLVVTTSNDMRTLPVGLATLQTPTGGLPELLAGATLGIAPTIIVFLLFQRFFVRGVVMSGLKG